MAMEQMTRIDWTISTGDKWWSGTDDTVQVEIWNDSNMIIRLNVEPGDTSRLNRGETVNYYWVFRDPSGLGTSVSGTTVPYYVRFPQGVAGHLRVKFIAKGDDAWEKVHIDSTVTTGALHGVEGTIDSVVWVEEFQDFAFSQDVVISTDTDEGHPTWTLRY